MRRAWCVIALSSGLGLVGGACMGPPWYLGAPLDGREVIPPQSRALTVAEHRRAADQAHAEHRLLLELEQLLALDERQSLRDEERRRLIELLLLRTRDWSALRRPLPLAADLRHLVALAPERAYGLGPRLRVAEIAAGDEWLAIGENARAEAEYRQAEKLGGERMDFRFRAAWGAKVEDLDLATIERAMSELPERALASFTTQYLARTPAPKPRLVRRAWVAARSYGPPALLARIEALPIAERFRAEAAAEADLRHGNNTGDRTGGETGPAAAAIAAGAPATIASGGVPSAGQTSPRRSEASALREPAPDDFLDGGPTLARRLIPAARAFPHLLDPNPRSRAWAERLVNEDPQAPDSLELAAMIDARAGREGGAARKLSDLVYFSRDRAAGYERAARVWQQVGRTRMECVAWNHATRVGPIDDPRWCELLACVKRDPGVGDAEAVAARIRDRAPTLACAGGPLAPSPIDGAVEGPRDEGEAIEEGDRAPAVDHPRDGSAPKR